MLELLKQITTAFKDAKLPEQILEAAKDTNKDRIETLKTEFKDNHPEIWEKLEECFRKFDEGKVDILFGNSSGKPYNPSEIDPLSLLLVEAILNEMVDIQVDIYQLFEVWEDFLKEVRNVEPQIADFIESELLKGTDSLVNIFN